VAVVKDVSSPQLNMTISVGAVGPVLTGAVFGVYWIGDLP
jgi:hypothetical protein